MYISKKDLLAITGISYGQLYRWKRERLIPEEWFMKQSSFTGQETFFPREQILSRIRSILELKDKYSLEELAKLLSPEVVKNTYKKAELGKVKEINQELTQLFDQVFQKQTYDYIDVLIMVIASELRCRLKLDDNSLSQSMRTTLSANTSGKILEMKLIMIQADKHFYTILVKEEENTVLDERLEIVYQRNMSELSNEVKIKYGDMFR